MIDKFWESLGEELAKRWFDYLFGPAFLFWGGGFGLYLWQQGWEAVKSTWNGWQIYQQATVILAALLLVFLSSLAVEAVQLPVLRILEGYWPKRVVSLFNRIVQFAYRIAGRKQECFQQRRDRHRNLRKREEDGTITQDERDELASLEAWSHRHPPSEKDQLPTSFGNLLRARELSPKNKYGLDAIVCWPRLWSLLPESEREDLTSARSALNRRAELCLWGFLFVAWAIFNPLVVIISVMWILLAYRMALPTAEVYGDLLETAFDIHRLSLYDAMGWPRPKNSDEEKDKGAQLSEFLWRGTTKEKIQYIDSPPKPEQ